nr:hypothetical protein [Candidatus Paceibacterota bacterium]
MQIWPRFSRIFLTILVAYLIQALSFSTLYAAVINLPGTTSSVKNTEKEDLGKEFFNFFSYSDSQDSSADFFRTKKSFNLLNSKEREIFVAGSILHSSFLVKAKTVFAQKITTPKSFFGRSGEALVATASKNKAFSINSFYYKALPLAYTPKKALASQSNDNRSIFFLDKVSLEVFCNISSVFILVDKSKCDYEKLLAESSSVEVNKQKEDDVLSVGTTSKNGSSYEVPHVDGGIKSVASSTVYIVQYVTTPGPAGKDGRDGVDGANGKDGKDGASLTGASSQSTFNYAPFVSASSNLTSSSLTNPTILSGTANLLTLVNSLFTGTTVFSGPAVFNSGILVDNIIATSSRFINASTTNLTISGVLYDSLDRPGTPGQILVSSGTSTYWSNAFTGTILGGTATNSTIYWNGTTWIENTGIFASPSGNLDILGDLSVGGALTVSSTTITNLSSLNATATNFFASSSLFSFFSAGTGTITSFSSERASIINANITNATVTTFAATNASTTNATSSTFFATLLNAVTAIITDL